MKYLSIIAIVILASGCSSVRGLIDTSNLIDYSNHQSVKVLEVPADLDKPVFDNTYVTDVSDKLAARNVALPHSGVPLVDNDLTKSPAESLVIEKQGTEIVLKVGESDGLSWGQSTDALTAMGLTISKSDQTTGVIHARDRSVVSSTDTAIGQFLNRTVGRVNSGTKYQIVVKDNLITFMDKAGGTLKEDRSRELLTRLRKELISSI